MEITKSRVVGVVSLMLWMGHVAIAMGQSQDPVPPVPSQVQKSVPEQPERTLEEIKQAAQRRIESSLRMIQEAKEKEGSGLNSGSNELVTQDRMRSLENRLRELKKRAAKAKQNRGNPTLKTAPEKSVQGDQLANRSLETPVSPASMGSKPKEFSDTRLAPPSQNPDAEAADALAFPEEFSKPVAAYELAKSLFMSGNISEAERQFERLKEEDPNNFAQNAWAQLLLANSYRLKGKIDQAQVIYRQIIASKKHFSKDQPLPPVILAADWYLAHSEKMKIMFKNLDQLEQQIELIEERRNPK